MCPSSSSGTRRVTIVTNPGADTTKYRNSCDLFWLLNTEIIPFNPPPLRGSLPGKSLISRMDWVSRAGDINLLHTPFPPARFHPNKICAYFLQSPYLFTIDRLFPSIVEMFRINFYRVSLYFSFRNTKLIVVYVIGRITTPIRNVHSRRVLFRFSFK